MVTERRDLQSSGRTMDLTQDPFYYKRDVSSNPMILLRRCTISFCILRESQLWYFHQLWFHYHLFVFVREKLLSLLVPHADPSSYKMGLIHFLAGWRGT